MMKLICAWMQCVSMHVFYPEGALTGMLLSGSNVELAFLEDAACVFVCHVCVCVCEEYH